MSKIEYAGITILCLGELEKFESFIPDQLEHSLFCKPLDFEQAKTIEDSPDIIGIIDSEKTDNDGTGLLELLSGFFPKSEIFLIGQQDPKVDIPAVTFINADMKPAEVSRKIFSKYLEEEGSDEPDVPIEEKEKKEQEIYQVEGKILIMGSRQDAIGFVPLELSEHSVFITITVELPGTEGQPLAILLIQPAGSEVEIDWKNVSDQIKGRFADIDTMFLCNNPKALDEEVVESCQFGSILHPKLDHQKIKRKLASLVRYSGEYFPVSLFDVNADSILPMDLYVHMPLAGKYLRFVKAGQPMEQERYDRLESKSVNTLFIKLDELESFYKYWGEQFSKIQQDQQLSVTERRQKISEASRTLFSHLLVNWNQYGEEQTQEILNETVAEFLKETDLPKIKRKVREIFTEHYDLHDTAQNISTMAVVFSLVSGVGDSTELATAGLLMDTGFIKLPANLADRDLDDLSFDALDMYKSHPELSLEVLAEKKINISENVKKLIREHHELYNGSGFPKSLTGVQISSEAAILTLADLLVSKIQKSFRRDPLDLFDELISSFEVEGGEKVEPKFARDVLAKLKCDDESENTDGSTVVA